MCLQSAIPVIYANTDVQQLQFHMYCFLLYHCRSHVHMMIINKIKIKLTVPLELLWGDFKEIYIFLNYVYYLFIYS